MAEESKKIIKIKARFTVWPGEKGPDLHHYAVGGHLLEAKRCLFQDPNVINHNWSGAGGTPLHAVLANEKCQWAIEILDTILLIEKKANKPILDFSIVDRELKTLLILAAKLRQWEFIRYLFEKFPRVVSIINKQDDYGRTALHYAALYGDLSTVRFFVQQGANVALKDKSGATALESVKQGSDAVIEALVSIEVHPDRSFTAEINSIPAYENGTYLHYPQNDIDEIKRLARMLESKGCAPPELGELIQRFEMIIEILNGRVLATYENLETLKKIARIFFPDPKLLPFLKSLVYDKRSVLDVCLEGQEQILAYFSKTPVYEITSNETVRINQEVRKKFGILSAGLGDNQIAIILRDALGNMSVTIVANEKELRRIPDEAKALSGELASLDIITRTGSETGLAKKALSLYEQIQVQNSKKTKEVRTTKTGVILLAEDRMLAPDEKQVAQFKTSSETLSDKHSLVNYRPTLCRSSGNIHELIGEVAGVIEKRSVQPVQNMVGSTPLSIPEVSSTFFAGSVVPGNMVVTPGSSGGPPIGVNGMAKSADF